MIWHDDLSSPTVADVIAFLSKMDTAKKFCIEDPDTGWTISNIKVTEEDDTIWFTGDYNDMDRGY